MKSIKRRIAVIIIAAAIVTSASLSACTDTQDISGTNADTFSDVQTGSAGKSDSGKSGTDKKDTGDFAEKQSGAAVTKQEQFSERDLSGKYDESSAVTVTCSDSGFTVSGSGAQAKDNVLTISEEGIYIISGSAKNGRIVVNAADTDKVQLVLSGCSLTSSDNSALYVKNADKVFLTLAEGTKNSLSDGKTYSGSEDGVDSAVYSKTDLTINGSGELTVTGSMSHAIVSKDDLKITGGTITVKSADSAVTGKDSVRIANAEISITSGGDGIKSTNDKDSSKGYVYLESGKITITAENDAIQAQSDIITLDAEVNAATGGGSSNSAKTHTEGFGGIGGFEGQKPDGFQNGSDGDKPDGFGFGGQNPEGFPGGMQDFDNARQSGANTSDTDKASEKTSSGSAADSKANDSTPSAAAADSKSGSAASDTDTSSDSTSAKGLKAGGSVTVSGGSVTLDCADDAIHADGSVTVKGGSVSVKTGDDGIHAAENVLVSGGTLTISESYEGVEAKTITVSDGTVDVTASDDGMNATDGISEGGMPGMNIGSTEDSDVYILISGGKLHVNAGGDGIDSNGTLKVTGGDVTVDGPTNSGNGALDAGSGSTITGGTVIAVGSSGMAEAFGESSSQGSILYNMQESHSAGEKITLKDSSGKVIAEYTAQKTFNSVVISTPEIKKGSKYTLTVGSESYTIEMSSLSYSNGGGMGMGGAGGMRGMGGTDDPNTHGGMNGLESKTSSSI